VAKFISDAIIDLELDVIAAATILVICAGQPTSYADATGTKDLATHIIGPADFSKADADGAGGGRKLTLAAQAGIAVDHAGHADHFMLGISASSTMLYIGTLGEPHSDVLANNLTNFPATDVLEIGDVT
jgi:hypothetical protein